MARLSDMGEIYQNPQLNGVFEWTLPNVYASSLNPTTSCITSPRFSFMDDKWCFALLLNDNHDNTSINFSTTYVGVFLWMKNRNHRSEELLVEICLEPNYHRIRVSGCRDFGVWKFLELRDFSESKNFISANGKMTFTCKMRIANQELAYTRAISSSLVTDVVQENGRNEVPKLEGIDRLLQNFKEMFLEAQNSDIILKVEDQEIPAHRAILSARSPVFTSMFEHHMSESISGVVNIPDCSPEAFRVLLQFLYTGNTDTISSENVFDLFYAADKYRVDDLKNECSECAKKILSVATFCDFLALSLKHDESKLLKTAIDFFRDNMKTIIKTVQWQTFILANPIQGNELLIKAVGAEDED